MAWTKREQEEAKEELRRLVKPGDTLTTVIRHVSRSGMSRSIDVYKFESVKRGEVCKLWLSHLVCKALNMPFDSRCEAVKIGGCGMDMGFAIVNSLSYVLHGRKDRGVKAIEASRRGVPFRPTKRAYRAGYSIRQEWLG